MIEAIAIEMAAPIAAYVAPIAVKKKRSRSRSSRKGWVAPAVVVGTWILLTDGRQCRVSAVLPDGRVYCSEVVK